MVLSLLPVGLGVVWSVFDEDHLSWARPIFAYLFAQAVTVIGLSGLRAPLWATAGCLGLVLVTNNVREFERVSGLRIENRA